jgi:hypothetical protein
MPARTLNDFLAGFFITEIRVGLEVKMTIALRKSQGNGFGDAETIKVEGRRDNGKEVRVYRGIFPPKWNAWNHEGFSREWSKTYLS